MDIYEYLKKDHEKVNKLFEKFEATDKPERQIDIVEKIAQELIVHARSEQDTFYEALKQFEEGKDEAKHGKKEHKEVEDQIKKVVRSEPGTASWESNVLKLKEIVQHHVKEEEGEMFDKAKKYLSDKEARAIKKEMANYKKQVLQQLDA